MLGIGKKAPPPPPEPDAWYEAATAVKGLSNGEAMLLILFVGLLFYVRMVGRDAMRKALATKGARTLSISALARAAMFKEIFLAYLNAAILEPLLSIANTDVGDHNQKDLVISGLQLLGLIFWTYMVTDAFDTADTAASFVYRYKVAKDKQAEAEEAKALVTTTVGLDAQGKPTARLIAKPADQGSLKFLVIKKRSIKDERDSLGGSLTRDVALWFCLVGIFAAFAGVVTHRDVVHSWAVVLLWAIMHHQARAATSWGAGYFATLLMPSAALMPLEYCLPLMGDLDIVGDTEGVQDWHAFVLEQTGIELRIEA